MNGHYVDDNNSNINPLGRQEYTNDSIIAMAVRELGRRFGQEDVQVGEYGGSAQDSVEGSDTIASTEDDWMYLAQ